MSVGTGEHAAGPHNGTVRVADPIIAACHSAAVVATGRRGVPDQNNAPLVLGIFRGALDGRALRITPGMRLAAAQPADVARLAWERTDA